MKQCASYGCDEAVEGLSPLCVFHRDWTQIIAEPNGWDDASGVTVSHIFLRGGEKNTALVLNSFSVSFLKLNAIMKG